MGCSHPSKKNKIKLSSLQLPQNLSAIQQDESDELAILNLIYRENYQIKKNPIVQRRVHSATSSIHRFDYPAELYVHRQNQ